MNCACRKFLGKLLILLLIGSSQSGLCVDKSKTIILASIGILSSTTGLYFSYEGIKQPLYLKGICETDAASFSWKNLPNPVIIANPDCNECPSQFLDENHDCQKLAEVNQQGSCCLHYESGETRLSQFCAREAIANRTTSFEYQGPNGIKPQIDEFFASIDNRMNWLRSTYCSEIASDEAEFCSASECIRILTSEEGVQECFLDLGKIKEVNEEQLHESLSFKQPHGNKQWSILGIASVIGGLVSAYLAYDVLIHHCPVCSSQIEMTKVKKKSKENYFASYYNYFTFSGRICGNCGHNISSDQMIYTCENGHPLHKHCREKIERSQTRCTSCYRGGLVGI